MISEKKQLEIATVCYANVSGNFAMFCNPKFRGENFTWEWFIEYCESHADMWMMIHGVKGDKNVISTVAKTYAKEIAETLIRRMNDE